MKNYNPTPQQLADMFSAKLIVNVKADKTE